MPSGDYNTRAITLACGDAGEKDVLATLFSLERGRTNVIVKGTKKLNSSLRGATQLLSLGECYVACRRGTDLLVEWLPVHSFPGIKTDLEKFSLASYFARFVMELTERGEPEPELFRLLENIFLIMQINNNYDIMKLTFEWGFLDIFGMAFGFSECGECGRPFEKKSGLFLNVQDGMSLCASCAETIQTEKPAFLGLGAAETGKIVIDVFRMLSGEIFRGERQIVQAEQHFNRLVKSCGPSGSGIAARMHNGLMRFMQYHISDRISDSWFVFL